MKPTMLIMAAGMGNRYGGLKQIDPIGPNGEIIIDYAIYDAVRAGFGKLVFVIRHCFEEAFREKIGSKFDGIAETAYAYQELGAAVGGFAVPPDRQKPWGTGHAILITKDVIDEPFAVINADDYYGPNSFKLMSQYLSGTQQRESGDHAMVGYVLRNTLSEYGHVSRGVCECDGEMLLKKVTECTKIEKTGKTARYIDEEANEQILSGDEVVSMNLWGFGPLIFKHLERQFGEFLAEHGGDNKTEFCIPSAVDELIHKGQGRVRVLPTPDSWFGVTYRQDKETAVAKINELIKKGVYPERLW